MKRLHRLSLLLVLASCLGLVVLLPVFAADTPLVPEQTVAQSADAVPPPLIITEVQTGLATAGDEFVELYNTSDATIDLTGWQVRYQNATATASSLLAVIGDESTQPVVAPHGYFVLHTDTVLLPAAGNGQRVNARLSSADKTIALYKPDAQTCKLTVQDALAWGAATGGEGAPVAVTGSGDRLVYRLIDDAGMYATSRNNAQDFASVIAATTDSVLPTPAAPNTALQLQTAQSVSTGALSTLVSLPMADCVVPGQEKPTQPVTPSTAEPVLPTTSETPPAVVQPASEGADDTSATPTMPARNNGLYAPQISELLPNPAKPQTDANDEFIELYNPNTVSFELSGFVLESGVTTKKRYTFPDGTLLPAKAFVAFFSKDTAIALSNTQGQVWLLDPLGRTIAQSDPYADAKDGQSWLTADSKWQWSTQPTPAALNVIRTPATKAPKQTTQQSTATSSKQSTSAAAVKGATTTAAATSDASPKTSQAEAAAAETFNPLHPAILAITGVVAVSYGIYEYRSDLANKLRQFRANRAARAQARQKPARR
jgi:hypothetical protein